MTTTNDKTNPPQTVPLAVMRKRRDFVAAREGGNYYSRPALVVQVVPSAYAREMGGIRMGFTVTKKIGNAVVRNRIKRRLRAVAKELLPQYGRSGCDYVFIGRRLTRDCPYEQLKDDTRRALKALGRRMNEAMGIRD